jgi:E3 ubiquitin-protein ligase HUWE1
LTNIKEIHKFLDKQNAISQSATCLFLDGSGEFLDSWLMLVEKMVNVKNVLESTHTLPTKPTQPGVVPFDPVKYLVLTHKVCLCFEQFYKDIKMVKTISGHIYPYVYF